MKSPPSLPVPEPHVQPESVSSSPGRRQKALADALFGSEASKDRPPTPSAATLLSSAPADPPRSRAQTPEVTTESMHSIPSPPSVTILTQASTPAKSPISAGFSASSPNVSHVDAVRLAREVQQRAEAATAALRKSPSIPKMGEATGTPHHSRRHINPKQISSPTLVSSSASLKTVPLPSPSAPLAHKVSRFRKLTGTLRAKDASHHPHEQHPPASAPLPHQPSHFSPPSGGQPDQPAARHHGKTSSPDPSPPASASPGIKSFISRFRKPRAATESYSATHRERSSPSLAAFPPSSPSYNSLPATAQAPRSAPALQTFFDQSTVNTARARAATTESRAPQQVADSPPVLDDIPVQSDDLAIKQLFAAASDLGLDQKELHNLLARSPSTSSKLTRSASATESRKSRPLPGLREDTVDHSPSPPVPMGRSSTDSYSNRPSHDGFRPSMDNVPENVPEITLRPAREDAADNPIVRRTIIFPSDPRNSTMDLNAVMRKQSAARKRRSAGANSTYSNRSIHERVPTPPPHKHVGRRFSTDGSPPVPQVPPSMGTQGERLVIPGQLEASNSAYDSLCVTCCTAE